LNGFFGIRREPSRLRSWIWVGGAAAIERRLVESLLVGVRGDDA